MSASLLFFPSSKELKEFLVRETSLFDDGLEHFSFQVASVVRECDFKVRHLLMSKGVMASCCVVNEKACSLKSAKDLLRLESWQTGHWGWSPTRICSMTG